MAHQNIGAIHAAREEFETALAEYEKALEIDPKLALAYIGRAYVYEKLGRPGPARDDYDKALELDPGNAYAKKALKRLGPDYTKMRMQ
jgi:tetratricopeptide (TPR) repeat protein